MSEVDDLKAKLAEVEAKNERLKNRHAEASTLLRIANDSAKARKVERDEARRERDEAREILRELVIYFRVDFGDGLYESHTDTCIRWEHGLDENCDCPVGKIDAALAGGEDEG